MPLPLDQYWPAERPSARSNGAAVLIWVRSEENAGKIQYSDGDDWLDVITSVNAVTIDTDQTVTGSKTLTGHTLLSANSNDAYAGSVKNAGSGGAFRVLNATNNAIIDVAPLGGGGLYTDAVGSYFNTDYGRVTIGNVRNWTTNSDLFVAHNRLTGSPTGSFVPMFVGYNAVTHPTDGFNGSTGVPDEVCMSVVAKAYNVAAGASQNYDGSLRSSEFQTLVYANCGLTRTYGSMEVGIHTALNQDSILDDPVSPDNTIGSYGILVHSSSQTDPGFGTSQMANFGFLTAGDLGCKFPFAAFSPAVARLWSVDSAGKQVSGHIVPRAGSTYNLGGGSAGDFWSAFYGNFHVATTDGNAGGPVFTRSNQTTTGAFFFSGGMGFSSATAEVFRYDASALQMTLGERLTGAISPTQLTTNTDNYNPTGLSTARIIRLNASGAINLTGITAPAVAGQVLSLKNVSVNTITLKHETTSTAANRFNLPGGLDVGLTIHQAIEIWYDGAAGRWTPLGAV